MARYIQVVLSNAIEGKDAEFNDWYEGVHIPDVLRVPGCVSAERFCAKGSEDQSPSKHQYMTLYEWNAPSENSIRESMARARSEGLLRGTEYIDRETIQSWIFEHMPPGMR